MPGHDADTLHQYLPDCTTIPFHWEPLARCKAPTLYTQLFGDHSRGMTHLPFLCILQATLSPTPQSSTWRSWERLSWGCSHDEGWNCASSCQCGKHAWLWCCHCWLYDGSVSSGSWTKTMIDWPYYYTRFTQHVRGFARMRPPCALIFVKPLTSWAPYQLWEWCHRVWMTLTILLCLIVLLWTQWKKCSVIQVLVDSWAVVVGPGSNGVDVA